MLFRSIDDLFGYAKLVGIDESELADRLAMHRSTINRNLNHETLPKPSKFFGILVLGLRRNIHEVVEEEGCPTNVVALSKAVRLTLSIIRQKECAKEFSELSSEWFSFVQEFIWYPGSEIFVQDPEVATTSTGTKIIAAVAQIVRAMHPQGHLPNTGLQDHVEIIRQWSIPYALFWIGAEPIMESIRDAGIN